MALWTSAVFSTTTSLRAELLAGLGAVREQALAVLGIRPRPRHDARAALVAALSHRLDLGGHLGLGDNALLDQQLAQADLHELEIAERPIAT